MLLLPLLAELGWVQLSVPKLFPLGAVLGGYLFGVAMSWASGCAAGVWYKWGAGNRQAGVAVAGLALGATFAELGPLKEARELVQSVGPQALREVTLGELIHFDGIVYLAGALILVLLWRFREPAGLPGAWSWVRTGAALGALATLAWISSSLGGRPFGMAVVPGSVDAVSGIFYRERWWVSWDLFFVLSIPAGGFLAARASGGAGVPLVRDKAIKAFFGGAALGVTASFAAGCTVGHSLTGLPVLSLGSIVTTISILLGSWTVGWFEMKKEGLVQSSSQVSPPPPTQ